MFLKKPMQINIHDELSFDLRDRRERKEFLAHIHGLVQTEAFNDLMQLCKKLNLMLTESTDYHHIKDLLKYQNEVIASLEKTLNIQPVPKKQPVKLEQSSIGISFRHDEGKRMHGAFFDHYVFRNIAKRRTHILTSPQTSLQKLTEFSAQSVFSLNMKDNGKKIIPIRHEDASHDGLIVIPGYSRQLYDEERIAFENELIRKARLTGQPVLAICAGSWTLWNAYGGTTKAVEDHVYSSMPYIVSDGGIGNNKQIHQVVLKQHTFTYGALSKPGLAACPTVNSVHWLAPDPQSLPNILEISATAKIDEHIEVSSRQGELMQPEENSVEAFETKYGAPMIGIQWHPECFYTKQHKTSEQKRHLSLIEYMVLAGDTFQAKKRMLAEMQQTQKLEKISIFKTLTALHEFKTVEKDYQLHRRS